MLSPTLDLSGTKTKELDVDEHLINQNRTHIFAAFNLILNLTLASVI